MDNSFLSLLKGDFSGDDLVVSLKSAVPVFLSYPEIIIPFKARLSDVVPFYVMDEDYEDFKRNIILPAGNNPTQLIVLFTKVFEMIVKLFNSGDSKLAAMPKVSLKVDIGSSTSQFETIAPSAEQVTQFDNGKSKMFTFTGFNAVEDSGGLSYEQKHNLLLVDILTRKYNNSGLGGRR
ncbi:hypothetical protein [Lysinibacillus xylanilyticus]|uniref:hypothetical protein n=1 Tax=Lysinibacillus xylanilyticus TaxID=582475 RepID=UPI0036DAD9CD